VGWLVTIQGARLDVERLLVQAEGLISPTPSPVQATLEISGPDSQSPAPGRRVEASAIRCINGFGALRWGRAFRGVEIRSAASNGLSAERSEHLPLESGGGEVWTQRDDGTRVLPIGVDDVAPVRLRTVLEVAAVIPRVSLVLSKVEQTVARDAELDWGAAVAALELIEEHLHESGVCGEELGWLTHHHLSEFKRGSMAATDGEVVVRSVAARWIEWLASTSPGRIPR
jgi:hypothetical protein